MLTTRRISLVLAGLLIVLLVEIGIAEGQAERQVRERRQALTRAMNMQDVQALRGFYDPAYRFEGPGTELGFARLAYEWTQRFQIPGHRETLTIRAVRVQGDVATIRTTKSMAIAADPRRPLTVRGDYVEIWRRTQGVWRLVRERMLTEVNP